ncbi:hypothetical protein NMY22_g7438 [Coprinellus aureogranulatus]|nr:hypothetical protein NMY22_g7438 [Coprinellus aureogranulatus]
MITYPFAHVASPLASDALPSSSSPLSQARDIPLEFEVSLIPAKPNPTNHGKPSLLVSSAPFPVAPVVEDGEVGIVDTYECQASHRVPGSLHATLELEAELLFDCPGTSSCCIVGSSRRWGSDFARRAMRSHAVQRKPQTRDRPVVKPFPRETTRPRSSPLPLHAVPRPHWNSALRHRTIPARGGVLTPPPTHSLDSTLPRTLPLRSWVPTARPAVPRPDGMVCVCRRR